MSHLDGTTQTAAAMERLLSEGERQRARRYATERHRRRYIVARAGLRRLLAERLGIRPEAVELAYGRNGKPALAPRLASTGWRFNLSHSDGLAVYALARGREVGVDVEAARPLDAGDDIAARYFSQREIQEYRALAARDRPVGFFNCWTRKEAFVKALGVGLSLHLDRFDVSLAPGVPARLLRVDPGLADCSAWRLVAFSPLPGFVGALACQRT